MKKFALILLAMATIGANALTPMTHKLEPGTWILSEPGHVPSPNCDVFTKLTLDKGQMIGPFSLLEDGVSGFCEIYVFPNERIHHLHLKGIGCGSGYYEGQRITERGLEKITITDHRTRICRDLPPAQIIVTIESPNGQKRTLYGKRGPRRFPVLHDEQ